MLRADCKILQGQLHWLMLGRLKGQQQVMSKRLGTSVQAKQWSERQQRPECLTRLRLLT